MIQPDFLQYRFQCTLHSKNNAERTKCKLKKSRASSICSGGHLEQLCLRVKTEVIDHSCFPNEGRGIEAGTFRLWVASVLTTPPIPHPPLLAFSTRMQLSFIYFRRLLQSSETTPPCTQHISIGASLATVAFPHELSRPEIPHLQHLSSWALRTDRGHVRHQVWQQAAIMSRLYFSFIIVSYRLRGTVLGSNPVSSWPCVVFFPVNRTFWVNTA